MDSARTIGLGGLIEPMRAIISRYYNEAIDYYLFFRRKNPDGPPD
jgi:hypothetical protein